MEREVPALAKNKGVGRLEQEWWEPALPWLCLLLGERVEDQRISMTCFFMYFQGAGDNQRTILGASGEISRTSEVRAIN